MGAKVKVVTSGKDYYIDVPTSRASSLHSYLRARGVQSSPPEPSSTGIDRIALTRSADVKAVQAILDAWV
jgi:hypothetical protein